MCPLRLATRIALHTLEAVVWRIDFYTNPHSGKPAKDRRDFKW